MTDRHTNTLLTLDRVSHHWPDGRALFAPLSERFDRSATGLVGRNGVGKSVLARLMAGSLVPTDGRIERHAAVHYLPQHQAAASVAELAGLDAPFAALGRIEAGGAELADFELLGERWDLRQRWQAQLRAQDLPLLAPAHPAAALSGGERMRVALAGAFASGAELLILDEPSNHLDARQRARLAAALRDWPGGLILISHDRALLAPMTSIVELGPGGLTRWGGGYDGYAEARAHAERAAIERLDEARRERKRGEAAQQAERERQQRRQAQRRRSGQAANQAKILLDCAREGSEQGQGRLRRQQQRQGETLRAAQQAAHVNAQAWQAGPAVQLSLPRVELAADKPLCELAGVRLPFVALPPLDWLLRGPRRVAITGPNGCGKSSLLRLLAGRLAPLGGHCRRHVEPVYLDQQLEVLDGARPLLEQLRQRASGRSEAELRTGLARLGLGPAQVLAPSRLLSGGERLKAALALLLLADEPVPWLLLDEPSNHLDLPSLRAVEAMLAQYGGALCVVSHDAHFLAALRLDERLEMGDGQWRFMPAPG